MFVVSGRLERIFLKYPVGSMIEIVKVKEKNSMLLKGFKCKILSIDTKGIATLRTDKAGILLCDLNKNKVKLIED